MSSRSDVQMQTGATFPRHPDVRVEHELPVAARDGMRDFDTDQIVFRELEAAITAADTSVDERVVEPNPTAQVHGSGTADVQGAEKRFPGETAHFVELADQGDVPLDVHKGAEGAQIPQIRDE